MSKNNPVKYKDIGGQAVMEGVMMQSPANESMAIAVRKPDGRIVVTVTDTDCGMDEETQKHIFDKFYQGDVSHAAESNGLGLALVRRILAMTDASIQVRSRPGEGSSFTVTLEGARKGTEA